MRPTRLVLAAVLGVVGVIWLGQGLGFIGGSFMTGDLLWAAIGTALAGLAVAIAILELRRERPSR